MDKKILYNLGVNPGLSLDRAKVCIRLITHIELAPPFSLAFSAKGLCKKGFGGAVRDCEKNSLLQYLS
jgi:hypothetical protein